MHVRLRPDLNGRRVASSGHGKKNLWIAHRELASAQLPWSKEWINSGEGAAAARSIRDTGASPYEVDLQLAAPITKSAMSQGTSYLRPKESCIGVDEAWCNASVAAVPVDQN